MISYNVLEIYLNHLERQLVLLEISAKLWKLMRYFYNTGDVSN